MPGAASPFPDTHAQFTVDLIGTIRSELGETALVKLLERRREQVTAFYRKRLAREPNIARKLTTLADMRSAEGYMARVEVLADEGFLLLEDHCPICAAAMSCQGFCRIELQVFRNLLEPDWHIERGPSAHRRASKPIRDNVLKKEASTEIHAIRLVRVWHRMFNGGTISGGTGWAGSASPFRAARTRRR